MKRCLAESIVGADSLRRATGLAFCEYVPLKLSGGNIERWRFPHHKGVYIIGVLVTDKVIPLYCGRTITGFDNRFWCHFNSPAHCSSGPSTSYQICQTYVNNPEFFATWVSMNENSDDDIRDEELSLLGDFDFIANKVHNVQLRFYALREMLLKWSQTPEMKQKRQKEDKEREWFLECMERQERRRNSRELAKGAVEIEAASYFILSCISDELARR